MDNNESDEARSQPRYLRIESALHDAIRNGRLPQGAILNEGPVADVFGTSRTPARKALQELEEKAISSSMPSHGIKLNDPKRNIISFAFF